MAPALHPVGVRDVDLADPRLSLDKRNAVPSGYRGMALSPALDAHLRNTDPPDHTRFAAWPFGPSPPRHGERLPGLVRGTADHLLEALSAQDRFDLIACYAAPLPMGPSGDAPARRRCGRS